MGVDPIDVNATSPKDLFIYILTQPLNLSSIINKINNSSQLKSWFKLIYPKCEPLKWILYKSYLNNTCLFSLFFCYEVTRLRYAIACNSWIEHKRLLRSRQLFNKFIMILIYGGTHYCITQA
jgi:hypothetical protein